jgi:type IV fimbrial biogenesis protein FimT
MQRSRGLTLPELVTALTVLAVATSMAVPSFNQLRLDNERARIVNSFVHSLFLARSESIKRSVAVTLCPSRDGEYCAEAGTPWHVGWIVFANDGHTRLDVRDAGEDVIHAAGPWTAGTIHSNRSSYSFRPHRQGVVNGTIVFCDRQGSAHARAIIVSQTGRPRISQRDASRRPLQCPAQ